MLVLSKGRVLVAKDNTSSFCNPPGIAVTAKGFIITDLSQAQADMWALLVDEYSWLLRGDTSLPRANIPAHLVSAILNLHPAYYVVEEFGCISFYRLAGYKNHVTSKAITYNTAVDDNGTARMLEGALFIEPDLQKVAAVMQEYLVELKGIYWLCQFTLEPDATRLTRVRYCWQPDGPVEMETDHYLKVNHVPTQE